MAFLLNVKFSRPFKINWVGTWAVATRNYIPSYINLLILIYCADRA